MKQLFLLPVLCIGVMSAAYPDASACSPALISLSGKTHTPKTFQLETGNTRMRAAVFKAQDYCRAELKNFEFDARFDIVSAEVYFTGANFKNVEKASISSSSLQPIKEQMSRCVPGSVIIFDNVKVIGPDKTVRTIAGASIILY